MFQIHIVVRFLALVTMMVTKVDHGNHCSNDLVVTIVVTMMVTTRPFE